jgi:hypothetical protein
MYNGEYHSYWGAGKVIGEVKIRSENVDLTRSVKLLSLEFDQPFFIIDFPSSEEPL